MSKSTVFGIKLKQRTSSAVKFQEILTRYGCNIKTRIGLHHVTHDVCSTEGVILIEAIGDQSVVDEFENELNQLKEVELQKMTFEINE
ncbi:MAG: hypothetical protein AB1782_04895 [Cyanobacteriota bacterium]